MKPYHNRLNSIRDGGNAERQKGKIRFPSFEETEIGIYLQRKEDFDI